MCGTAIPLYRGRDGAGFGLSLSYHADHFLYGVPETRGLCGQYRRGQDGCHSRQGPGIPPNYVLAPSHGRREGQVGGADSERIPSDIGRGVSSSHSPAPGPASVPGPARRLVFFPPSCGLLSASCKRADGLRPIPGAHCIFTASCRPKQHPAADIADWTAAAIVSAAQSAPIPSSGQSPGPAAVDAAAAANSTPLAGSLPAATPTAPTATIPTDSAESADATESADPTADNPPAAGPAGPASAGSTPPATTTASQSPAAAAPAAPDPAAAVSASAAVAA